MQALLESCYKRPQASTFRAPETAHGPPPLFKWRHFTGEFICCAIRWELRAALSDRDVEALMRERGSAGRSHDGVSPGLVLYLGAGQALAAAVADEHCVVPR